MSDKRKTRRAAPTVSVKLVRLPHGEGLPLPQYQTPLSAGVDLVAALPAEKTLTLKPRERALIPTGLIFEIPDGHEAQVRPRSGLALKFGITVLNSPGTIDADYRGEVSVLLINLGDKSFKITRGERIAQLVIAPVTQAKLKAAKSAGKTKRGTGGFGSTGVKSKPKSKPKPKPKSKPKPKKTAKADKAERMSTRRKKPLR